ncbi:MAG: DUF3606 domain-containing protein, partial [Syntrophobacteraceae bacterium]
RYHRPCNCLLDTGCKVNIFLFSSTVFVADPDLQGGRLMHNSKLKRGPYANNRVNPHEPNEIKYWSQKFNCTEMELKHAVRAVGTSPEEVRNFLKKPEPGIGQSRHED